MYVHAINTVTEAISKKYINNDGIGTDLSTPTWAIFNSFLADEIEIGLKSTDLSGSNN